MGTRLLPGINDMATTKPELAAEWHPAKNGELLPTDVMAGTNKSVWWKCARGHEWQALVNNRSRGQGCPFCAGQKAWRGQNDMATTNPELAAEWHPTKNGDLSPHEVIAGTAKKLWWRCEHGHEWQSTGNNRVSGKGCPVCAGRVVVRGYNDMATTNPELAAEWHPTKNGHLTPHTVLAGTHRQIWWQCTQGHEWQSQGDWRKGGQGCPVCAGNVVLAGYNDLATTNPELAAEWHPTMNGSLTPQQVSIGSHTRIWWLCERGHHWQAQCQARRQNGCAVCANRQIIVGVNDLATTNPELAAEWHPTKNGGFTPKDIVSKANRKVWWLCDKGHEWQALANNRMNNRGCPVCSNTLVLAGYNDMATTNPELAAEWHPTKNGDLTPAKVVAGTNINIWWLCDKGHEWKATGNSRAGAGSGCPTCATFGFDPNKPAVLYFLANAELYARKVGITNVGTTRLEAFAKTGWRQLLTVEHRNGAVVRSVETAMFRWLRGEHALPQFLGAEDMKRTAGATETFSEEGPSNHEVIARIHAEFARLDADR